MLFDHNLLKAGDNTFYDYGMQIL